MAETVKIKLEFGEVELAYEGSAEFAKKDLLDLVGGLLEKLATVSVEMDEFEGFEVEEDDEEEDEEDEAAPEPVKGH